MDPLQMIATGLAPLLHAKHPLVVKGLFHPIVVFRIVSFLPKWRIVID